MTPAVNPIPADHQTVTPYLIVADAAAAIDFYRRAFNAEEIMRFEHDGKIGHAEIRIGSARLMLADEYPDMGIRGPRAIGGTPVSFMLYVADVDTFVAEAVTAGASLQRPVADQFYGDRLGTVEDPFGHIWHVATHVEDVPLDELHRRAAQQK